MLGFCRDPFMIQLHRLGYTLVPLPEAGIEVLDVYGRQGRELFRLGPLRDLFTAADAAPPEPDLNVEAAEMKITKSTSVDAGLGGAIVSDWLGGEQGKVSANLKDLHKFTFQLKGVKKDRVDLVPLDTFLMASRMNAGAPTFRRMLESSDVYVVTSALKALSVQMSSTDKESAKVLAAVPAAAGLPVSGKANVELITADAATREFKARTPLVFAVQAAQICFVGGVYKMLVVDRSGLQLLSDDVRSKPPATETGWLSDSVGQYFPRFATQSD